MTHPAKSTSYRRRVGWPMPVIVLSVLLGSGVWYVLNHEKPVVRIGLAINLTGQGGTANEYVREGVMLAVEEVNETGGIGGRRLELLIKDDKNTPEGIQAANDALIDAGVIAIVGPVTSRNTLIAYPRVMSRGVLLITPYAATRRLAGQDDLFFRTSVDTVDYGRGMASLLRERQARTLSLLMDLSNTGFVSEIADEVQQQHPARYTQVEIDYKAGVDWQLVIQKLLTPSPDTLVLLTEVSMTGIAVQKLRAADYQGPILASTWAQSPDLMRFGGTAVEGVSLVTFIDPDNQRDAYRAFAEKMRRRVGHEPNARSTRAYETIGILATALRASPSVTVQALREQLLQGTFHTLMGTVKFDAFGDVDRPIYEIQVRGGRFARLRQLP